MALTIGSINQVLDGFQDFNQGEITTTSLNISATQELIERVKKLEDIILNIQT